MTKYNATLLALAMGLLLAGPGMAVQLGDPAPPLSVSEWVKGSPIDLAAGKGENVYVVEFWATWCPPCRKSIPHLTEIQAKYKDKGVVVIGVSSEDAATVKPFVEGKGAEMDYVVAVDQNDLTSAAYMGAFGVQGIPHAFVIDKKGALVWHGHPMEDLEKVLDTVLAGNEINSQEAQLRAEIRELYPLWIREYLVLAKYGLETKEADAVAAKLLANGALVPEGAVELAWRIMNTDGLAYRNKELALQAAKLAHDNTDGAEAIVLGVYAQALFENGDASKAVAMAKSAISLAQDNDKLLAQLQEDLKRYEASTSSSM